MSKSEAVGSPKNAAYYINSVITDGTDAGDWIFAGTGSDDTNGHESLRHIYRCTLRLDDSQYRLAQYLGFDAFGRERLYAGQRCVYAGLWQ